MRASNLLLWVPGRSVRKRGRPETHARGDDPDLSNTVLFSLEIYGSKGLKLTCVCNTCLQQAEVS